jgi:hypothetical protein
MLGAGNPHTDLFLESRKFAVVHSENSPCECSSNGWFWTLKKLTIETKVSVSQGVLFLIEKVASKQRHFVVSSGQTWE